MRRSVILGLALLMAMGGLAAAWAQEGQGQELNREKVRVRASGVLYDLERHLAGMDEAIAFAREKGLDTNKLVALRDEFQSVVRDVKDVAAGGNGEKLGPAVSEARRIANDFREEGRRVLGQGLDEARRRVENATRGFDPALLNETYAGRAAAVLREFDANVASYGEAIGRLANGTNATGIADAQAKLAGIEGQRPALEAALQAAAAACMAQNAPPRTCDTPENGQLDALEKGIQRDFRELQGLSRDALRSSRVLGQVGSTRQLLGQVDAKLAKAAEDGTDVTAYRAKLGEEDRLLTSVEEEARAGRWDEAERDLRAAQEALRSILEDLGKERRELLQNLTAERRENATAQLKEKREELKERKEERLGNATGQSNERREELEARRENRAELQKGAKGPEENATGQREGPRKARVSQENGNKRTVR